MGLFPAAFRPVGLRPHLRWPFGASAVLVLANLGFLWHLRLMRRSSGRHSARANLWSQIILDLLVLTAVVHFVGSLETYVAFAYLFHIVLACIFFSRPQSLLVILMASVLYVSCVWVELAGIVPTAGIYAEPLLREGIEHTPRAAALNVVTVLAIWLVVWYLTSRLSAMVRERDRELAESNRRLEEAQQEKARHMLRMTHELKAPFSAIHVNAQLLLKGHCGVLPDEALDVVLRISKRCRRLSRAIQEMIQLTNLRSISPQSLRWVDLDLAKVLSWCVGQVRQVAEEHTVVIEEDLQPVRVVGVEEHLKMLFANLLANAVFYSHPGGVVHMQCTRGAADNPVVTIQDQGIGIQVDKLPRIFDEYYRTEEAARHNKESTGLGLTIVRHIVETYGIRVWVESAPGVGTKFTLTFPSTERQVSGVGNSEKERSDGIPAHS